MPGGKYIPPAKLRALKQQQQQDANSDSASIENQKEEWLQLKKKINGLVNKVSSSNIQSIVLSLFKLNLRRARGILVKTLITNQAQSWPYTAVYSSLVSVLNSKIPMIGKLLVTRLVLNFRKYYKRNDKHGLDSTLIFLASLMNFRVVHEVLIFQVLLLFFK